jgi:hypothetical protein
MTLVPDPAPIVKTGLAPGVGGCELRLYPLD